MGLAGAIAGLLVVFVTAVILVVYAIIAYRGRIDAAARMAVERLARLGVPGWVRRRWPRVWRAGERIAEWGAELGAAAVIGMGASIAALVVFAKIAEDTREEGERLVAFDLRVAQALHDVVSERGQGVMRAVSFVGSAEFLSCVGAAVALGLALRRRWALLIAWGAALAGGAVLNQALKHLFRRARPEFAQPGDHADTWSFPSGHSMGSLIAYGMLAYIIVLLAGREDRLAAKRKAMAIGVAAGLAVMIGISRMALGVHYFSDVAGGFAAGAAWLAACVSWAEVQRVRQREPRGAD